MARLWSNPDLGPAGGAAMRSAVIFDDATIMVHGDRGSRMTMHDPVFESVRQVTRRDLIDAYSTLFAVRSPGLVPNYDTGNRSLKTVFTEYLMGLGPQDPADTAFVAPTERNRMLPIVGPEGGGDLMKWAR